jgi:hypothetical protein
MAERYVDADAAGGADVAAAVSTLTGTIAITEDDDIAAATDGSATYWRFRI